MSKPGFSDEPQGLEPVHTGDESGEGMLWTARLVLFLRLMAVLSMLKGLYHWAQVCGIFIGPDDVFEAHSVAWQSATVFFAVIDLVAAVGLWLAAAWGAVIWLSSIASMITFDVFFPQVFGGGLVIDFAGGGLLAVYLWLALKSAQEQPA
jgi:hypothetical protein